MTFTKKGVVINLGAGGAVDDDHVFSPSIIYRNGLFWLYYSGYDGTSHRICLAISPDGLTFTKKGVVIDLGAGGAADDVDVYNPSVIYRNRLFWLYYGGNDGTNVRVCLAISPDGLTFTKKGAVIDLGAGGAADNVNVYNPSVIYRNGLFWLYYGGYDGTNHRICLAISPDGF